VSVRAADCTLADGLATAAMVMGAESGTALLERLPDVEGLVLVEGGDGRLVEHRTTGFQIEPVGPPRGGEGSGAGR
jgi:thiamine biosynthesis lipoprotein